MEPRKPHAHATLVMGALLALGLAPPLAAQSTLLYFNSQPGDYIGGGIRHTWTPADGAFGITHSENHVSLVFDDIPSTWWYVDFVAPNDAPLTVGVYEGAERYPFQSPTRPGLSVSGSGRGCNTLTGRFTVIEADYGPTGDVVKFAADFEQHCEGGPAALYGAVRYNSSVAVAPRLSVGDVAVLEGNTGAHDAVFTVSLSDVAATPVGVAYHTTDGTALASSDYVTRSGTLSFPAGVSVQTVAVPITGDTQPEATEFFFLDIDTPAGAAIAFGRGSGRILDDEGPATFLLLNSQPGDWVGQGIVQTLTPLDGTFSATRLGNGVQVHFDGSTWWDVRLVAPQDAPLVPGVYSGATRWPFQSPTHPGLDVSGDGRGCNELSGSFTVLEAVYGSAGEVQSFAADFEQHCEGRPPALFGSVRINSSISATPRLTVSGVTLYEGQFGTREAHFDVSLSSPVAGVVSVDYATANGTALAGSDYEARSGTLTFAAGQYRQTVGVPIIGDLVPEKTEFFFLDIDTPAGIAIAFGRGTGRILDDEGPATFLLLNSQPGDWVGQGIVQTLTPLDGTFSATRLGNGVQVYFDGSAGWVVRLVAPQDAPLVPGVYSGATRWPFQSPTHPGLDVSGDGRGCNELSGSFTVLEAVYGSTGEVQSFAADFEQHCESPPALFGSVRINSSISATPRLTVSGVTLYEGQFGTREAHFDVSLSSPVAGVVSVDYATANGTALAGSDYEARSGTLTFAAGQYRQTVGVPIVGDLVPEKTEFFFLDLAGASGAPVAVPRATGTILPDEGPSTWLDFESDSGDWVGQGHPLALTPTDGAFNVATVDNGIHVWIDTDTWWDLYFTAPVGGQLVPGVYENATRWPFQLPTQPGLSVHGDGRGCSELSGRFVVLEAAFDPGAGVYRFAADFEQHCENGPPALYGSIRFNSLVDQRPWKPVGAGDFDGDGFSDIVWRHDGDGRLSVWRMNPATGLRIGSKPLNPWRLGDLNWRVAGVGDLTADGQPDIFWRHELSGMFVVWQMNGLNRTGGVFLDPSQMPDLNWKPVALSDMDGDGKTDIVWRHDLSGRVVVWIMNGTTRISGAFTNPSQIADTRWRIRGAGDFDGDGKTDILWRHDASGAIVAWLMNGLTRLQGLFTTPDRWSDLDWDLVGTGFFNLDGSRDFIWRNRTTGQVRLWLMNNLVRSNTVDVVPNPYDVQLGP